MTGRPRARRTGGGATFRGATIGGLVGATARRRTGSMDADGVVAGPPLSSGPRAGMGATRAGSRLTDLLRPSPLSALDRGASPPRSARRCTRAAPIAPHRDRRLTGAAGGDTAVETTSSNVVDSSDGVVAANWRSGPPDAGRCLPGAGAAGTKPSPVSGSNVWPSSDLDNEGSRKAARSRDGVVPMVVGMAPMVGVMGGPSGGEPAMALITEDRSRATGLASSCLGPAWGHRIAVRFPRTVAC